MSSDVTNNEFSGIFVLTLCGFIGESYVLLHVAFIKGEFFLNAQKVPPIIGRNDFR